MHVPQWLALTIAAAVILFGCFRIYIAFGGKSDEERAQYRRGMYAMPRWQHGLVGVLFLLVAGALVATAFGWNPLAQEQPAPAEPGKGKERGSNAIIIDPLTAPARLMIHPKGSLDAGL